VRELDGLALSSRNGYLSAEERQRAPLLYQALREAKAGIEGGVRDYASVEAGGLSRLRAAGFRPDYFSVRRASNLAAPDSDDTELVVLVAAWLGSTRLIDNLPVRPTAWISG
jgi:pantoate--beta-alanine ligase